jgi:adenosylcobinamide kinase/adenosylcobinamide-phosphate guanylyltransferase
MGQLTLILGGARSGKSTLAQKLAQERSKRVLFIATAKALDEEMAARIAVHRKERPPHWETLELSSGVGQALRSEPVQAQVIILDCLTMLITNILFRVCPNAEELDEAAVIAAVDEEIGELISAIKSSPADWIIVSNEVGLGLVPPYPLGRIYRDALGRANQEVAAAASSVFWMVAGIPVPIHQYRV